MDRECDVCSIDFIFRSFEKQLCIFLEGLNRLWVMGFLALSSWKMMFVA